MRYANRIAGFDLKSQNLLDHQYVVKIANGFKSQRADALKVSAPARGIVYER